MPIHSPVTATLTALDRLEIQELMARYAWSLDTGDEDAFIACFARDGELMWDVFDTPGHWRGHEALRRFISYFRGRPETAERQHYVGNLVLSETPDGVRARAYVLVARRSGDGPHHLNVMGYYEDEIQREDGHWRLWRRVIRDWRGSVLARIAGPAGAAEPRPRPEILNDLWSTQSS